MQNLREVARAIFDEALADCSVEKAVAGHVSMDKETLYLGEEAIRLRGIRRVRIVAAGKASGTMLSALLKQLAFPAGFDITGVLIAPEGGSPLQIPDGIQYFAGGHPSPNESSFAGARAALTMLKNLPKESPGETLCFFLISGGASSMMELPLDPTISLADTADFHRALVASGAAITEMNCVRKHFSAVKGGRLALAAGDSICRTLLISDVPIGREDALGSGPTLPDPSTLTECREILESHQLLPRFPAAVRNFFDSSALAETPKPSEVRAHATVLLNAQSLAEAAARRAKDRGLNPVIDNSCDEWEYKAAARHLLERLRSFRSQQPRTCLISAGELSVGLPANHGNSAAVGVGGRNQQFALYLATLLSPADDPIAVLSAGSDGIDGNSPAAGAVLDREILALGKPETARHALESFNCYPFLLERDAAIVIGPSGNNLRDLRVLVTR